MGSLDLFKSVRGAYSSKEGFDVHTTSRHSEADPLADQLKGAWFCVQKGLLQADEKSTEKPDCYPLDCEGVPTGQVSNCFLDVCEKGTRKLKDNFRAKLYDSFPDLRFQLLF